MKIADIKTKAEGGPDYLAKIDWRLEARVAAIEKGIKVKEGYRGAEKAVGVRVRIVEDQPARGFSEGAKAGDEVVIASRNIQREWTHEDDAKAEAAVRAQERAEALRDRLVDLGFGVSLNRSFGGDTDAQINAASSRVSLTFDAAERLLALVVKRIEVESIEGADVLP